MILIKSEHYTQLFSITLTDIQIYTYWHPIYKSEYYTQLL